MKKGWFVHNGYYLSKSTLDLVDRFTRHFRNYDCEVLTLKSTEILLYLDSDGKVKQSTQHFKPDFVVFWDKDLNLARLMEKWGVRVYNKSEALSICDDKNYTYAVLAERGIPLVKTVFSPLLYTTCDEHDDTFLKHVEQTLHYPIIVKEASGSFGEQVYLAENFEQLKAIRKKLRYLPHQYQEFVEKSRGTDVRMIFIGDQFVAGMRRRNLHDFRANVELGGVCEEYQPTPEMIALGQKTVEAIGLDYAGIDILLDDVPKVCEVNSNAYVKGITQTSGVDVVDEYIRYILSGR